MTTQPPASVTAGSGFGLVVTAEDGFGNVDPTFTGSVTLALANNPGGATLGGTLTVQRQRRRGDVHGPDAEQGRGRRHAPGHPAPA